MNYLEYFRELHKNQKRKYTGNPYSDHLAEVAGIAAPFWTHDHPYPCLGEYLAVCWGHDSVEDQGCTRQELHDKFGYSVASGITWLSDLEVGNRAQRQAFEVERLNAAPGWVQTIKCADILSNTASIVQHDPDFAKVYLREVGDILQALQKADRSLREYVSGEVAKCL